MSTRRPLWQNFGFLVPSGMRILAGTLALRNSSSLLRSLAYCLGSVTVVMDDTIHCFCGRLDALAGRGAGGLDRGRGHTCPESPA